MSKDDPYGGLPPHEDGSDTSFDAAMSQIGHVKQLRARVLRFFELCGAFGATDDEIEAALDMAHQTASPRRRELELRGEVHRTAERRRTRRKRYAHVYVVVSVPLAQGALPW